MRLELVTLRFDPESGGFPPAPLDNGSGAVVSVVEHFFHHEGWPWLLLVVHRRPVETPRPTRGTGADPGAELDEAERTLYERLRTWRNGRAEADGLPPYAVFTNRQLVDLARRRPVSKAALGELSGVGAAKVEKYGQAVLEVLGVQP